MFNYYFDVKLIVGIIILHFIADYVFQTHWNFLSHWNFESIFNTYATVLKKYKNKYILPMHVIIYTLVIMWGGFIIMPNNVLNALIPWAILNGILHAITDFITNKINKVLWNRDSDSLHAAFTMIGLDQVIHLICLFVTYSWIYSHLYELHIILSDI